MQLEMDKIQAILTDIEQLAPQDAQSTEVLIEVGIRYAGYLPYTGTQMALAKKILNERRAATYDVLIKGGSFLSPSTMKDYIASKTSEEQFNYDLCERCNRSLVHVLDYLRSVLSTLKEEMKISQYQNFTQ